MKNFFTAIILGITFASASFAQNFSLGTADLEPIGLPNKTRIAVVEFTPGTNASGMTAEAKRHLQASIAFSLFESGRFDVVDVRNTRSASQASLPSINGDGSTAAAVKIGKQLGVGYILAGSVAEYNTKTGQFAMKTRLIEVATGRVKHSGQTTGQSGTAMSGRAGEAEMMSKVLKPAIKRLTADLVGLNL